MTNADQAEQEDDGQFDLEDELLHVEQEKQRRWEVEKQRLERAADSAGKLDTVQERVAWILNQYPETRDSDRELWFRYWGLFDSDNWDGHSINLRDAYRVTHPGSLTRARAKVQNTYGLFQATPDVRQRRGKLSDEERDRAVAQRPPTPIFSVYADESGQNAQNLIVASIWFLHGPEIIKFRQAIDRVKSQHDYHGEFHFRDVDDRNLAMYVNAVREIVGGAAVASFKAATVPRAGIARQDKAFEDLFAHLLIRGIEHEHATGRAELPRRIAFTKDREEEGRDRLMLANLEERVRQASSTRFDDRLFPSNFIADDSRDHELLQVADLFAGSLNRRLNAPGNGPKDRLAAVLLEAVGMVGGPQEEERIGDLTIHIAL
jgi:hypothetical protein